MLREGVRSTWFSAVLAVALALLATSRAEATGQAPIESETTFYRTPDGERSASRVRNVSNKDWPTWRVSPRKSLGQAAGACTWWCSQQLSHLAIVCFLASYSWTGIHRALKSRSRG